jgi:hypothetical protein
MSKINTYMQINIDLFTDPITGEVNESAMAEDACNQFGIPLELDGSAPDRIYFAADTLARRHEIKTGAREPRVRPEVGEMTNHVGSNFEFPRVK